MRLIVALLTFALAAWNLAPFSYGQSQMNSGSAISQGQKPAADSTVEFLLTTSANDFHAHQPPVVDRVRNVRFGHIANSDGTKQYVLCGEFLPKPQAGKAEWTPFVTIKTDPYEQWLGGQATSLCQPSQFVREKDDDLSGALQKRLDALR
jgi:hypothetical protein